MKRIAIIPARAGSKRIPKKNIKKFCGKPIISYTLDTVNKSKLFDVIHVSTDSESIQQEVARLGCPIDFHRPVELADDYTPIMPVLKYVCEEYLRRGQHFDQIWMVTPTSPFLEAADLQDADKLFIQSGGKAPLLGVSEYQAPIEWAFKRKETGKLEPVQPGMFSIRSQDLEPKYFDIGSFAIFPAANVLESEGAGKDTDFIGLTMPKYKAVDIDTPDDWVLAEALYRGLYINQES